MSFFKKIKSKLAVVFGAVTLAVGGAGYWIYEKQGYDENVLVIADTMGLMTFGGDGGLNSPQRAEVVKELKKTCPKTMLLGGDNCYDKGCLNEQLYQEHIEGPFGDICGNHKYTFLTKGNHDWYGSKEEKYFMDKKFKLGTAESVKPIGKVYFPNYYYGVIFEDACIFTYDTSVYEVKFKDPKIQKRQQKFVHKFVRDERCVGKPMYGWAHHGVYGKGSHGPTKSKDYFEFFEESMAGWVDALMVGHSHSISSDKVYMAENGPRRLFNHWTAGSLAKSKECSIKKECWDVAGYLFRDKSTNAILPKLLHTVTSTIDNEEEEE